MSHIERIKKVLRLERSVYREIRDDPKATAPALTVMVLAIFIGSARKLFEMPHGGIVTLMSLIMLWFVPSSLFYVAGKYVGGRSGYPGYMRATGYAQIPLALIIIPEIGWMMAILLWFIYMTVATKQAHELSKRKAVCVIFIPVALAALLLFAMTASEAFSLCSLRLF